MTKWDWNILDPLGTYDKSDSCEGIMDSGNPNLTPVVEGGKETTIGWVVGLRDDLRILTKIW